MSESGGVRSVDTSATAATEQTMHGHIADAAAASANYWAEKADANRTTHHTYGSSGDPKLAAGAEAAGREAGKQQQVASNRAAIAGHHREKAAS